MGNKGLDNALAREKDKDAGELPFEMLSVIHELRNSLCIISGFAQITLTRAPDNVLVRADAQSILEEVKRCVGILTFFVSKKKKSQNRMRQAYFSEIIGKAVNAVRPLFAHRNVSLLWRRKGSFPPVLCEPESLETMILNILKNALEATESGGKVKVESFSSLTEQVLIVSDTGCGVREENVPYLFEKRFSTKSNGFGAGLVICKRIAEQHGGTISVTSEEGAGTTVTVRLPLYPSSL